MNRTVTFFLKVMVPVLAALLAWLGWQTLFFNMLGHFLLITGLVFSLGVLIYYWISKMPSRISNSGDYTIHEEKSDLSFWLILPGMIIPFFISPIEYLYFLPMLPHNKIMEVAGLIMVFAFSALFIWARKATRKFYSGHLKVTKEQNLIQSGPYRYVRHPAYASYLLMTLGVSLGYSSIIGIGAVIFLLLPAIIYRIYIEEGLLIKRFGQLYIDYSGHTSRLIPGVW